MKQIKWILSAAFAVVMASACGYHLVGGGYLDENVTRVTVDVFQNSSSEAGAGNTFTNELVRQIMERTDTKVVNNAAKKISGTIKSITFSTLSRTSSETVSERSVKAVVDVKLTDSDGNILWSVKDFSASESYSTASDTVDDESNKRQAVETIAERVAERLVSQMVSNF